MGDMILSNNHWVLEHYEQRMTTREWKEVLLNHSDTIIFCGHIRQLKAKSLGCGIVSVSKEKEVG